MPDTQLIALASGIGAATGGFVTMVENIINNRYLLARDQAQWERDRRSEQEKSDRVREDEQKKWAREQITANFQDCIHHLGHISSEMRNPKSPGFLEHEIELRKSLAALLAAWPDKNSKSYCELRPRLWNVFIKIPHEMDIIIIEEALLRLVTEDDELSLRGPKRL